MVTLSLSEVKMKLSGRPVAVLISPDEFESWRETEQIRSDSDLMQEIKSGLSSLRQKKTSLYTLEELFD